MSTTTTPHTITPLPQLHPPSDPSTPTTTTTFVNLTVSLLWPYSSSSRLLRLVLSEKDPRLRAHKGQVHVTFRGASARALSGVEIGDEVLLGLQGAEWTEWKDGDGKRERDVDWKLEFTGRCWAQVTKTGSGAGSEEVMVVDVEGQEEEDQQEQKQHPESPDQQQDSVTVAAESSPEFISQDTYTLTTQEWKTPVSFNKRRAPDSPLLSASGTYFGNLFDDEEADLAALEEEELRPRKKPRFSQSSYRLISSDAPSPEGEKGRGKGWKESDEAEESGVSFFSSQTVAVEQEEDAETVDAKGGETMQYTIPGIEVPNEDRMDLTADFDKPEMPPPPAPSQAPEPDEGVEEKSQPQQQQPQAPASPDLKPVDSWGLPLVSPLESKGVMFTDYMGTRPLGTQEATTEETPIQDQEASISRPQSTGGYVSDITENDSLFNSRPASPPEAARKLQLPRSPRPSPLRNVGQFESPKSQLWRRKEDVQQEEEIVAPLQLPRPQPVTGEEGKEEEKEKEEEREEQEEKPSPQPDPPSILDEQQEETEKEAGEYEKAEVEEEGVSEEEEEVEVEVEEGSYQSETEKDQDEETEVEYEEVGSDDVDAGSVEEAEVEEVDVEEEGAYVEEVESPQEDWRELAEEEEKERGESDVEEVEVEEEGEAEEEVEVEVEEIEEETEEDEVEEVESGEEEEGEVEKVEAEVEEEGVEEIAEVEEVESGEEEEGEVEVVEAEVEEVEEYEVEEAEEEEVQEYEERDGYNENEYEEAEETEVDEVEVEEEETESEEEEEQHHQQETEKSEIPTQPTQPPLPSPPTNDTNPPAESKSPASITTDPPKAPSVSVFTTPLHAYFQPKPTPIPAADEEEEGEEEEREEQEEEEKIQPSALVNHHHSTTITIPPQEMFKASLKVPASNETLQSGKTVLLAASSEAAVTGSTTTITTTILPPHPHILPSSTPPLQPGITTLHSDFPPLSTLHRRYNITADILSLICRSKPIERAKSGPRDYFVTFRVIDPSSFPPPTPPPTTDPPKGLGNIGTTITLFRPHKPALPTPLSPGDVILLRDIKIVSQRGGVVGGVSCRTSAWAVWPNHYHHHASPPEHPDGGGSGGGEGSEPPSIVGPPVEFGREEVEYVRKLRLWWDGLGDGVRRELGVWPEETGKGKRKGKSR